MFIDGRSISSGTKLNADICIIGAGAAGITLALELAGKSLSVTLLESGGFERDPDTQALYKGDLIGLPNIPLDVCRVRYFGGSTGSWGGWCRQFTAIDFEKRSWVPHSGWPITLEELSRYYPRAHEICQISDGHFDPSDWELDATPPLPLWGDEVQTKLVQFNARLRFGNVYRSQIEKAANIKVLLNSNVVSIDVSPNGKEVDGLTVATLAGQRFGMRARQYVLATGGIENPRLLLASNRVLQHGLGNDHDLVGRYFMDHIQLDCAQLLPLDPKLNLELYQLDSRDTLRQSKHANSPRIGLMGYLTLSDAAQRQAQTLNYGAHLYRSYWSDFFLHVNNPDNPNKSWWRLTADAIETIWGNVHDAAAMALERLPGRDRKPFYKIVTEQEQAPNPDSRITLSDERDALDMPRVKLDWRLSEIDRHTVATGLKCVAQAFGGKQLAHLRAPLDFTTVDWPKYVRGSWHHYGTTKMSDNPQTGVVDSNCKVFGLANLYVGGCSVFPTSGDVNPTLSIVAMSVRLAEHLQSVVKH